MKVSIFVIAFFSLFFFTSCRKDENSNSAKKTQETSQGKSSNKEELEKQQRIDEELNRKKAEENKLRLKKEEEEIQKEKLKFEEEKRLFLLEKKEEEDKKNKENERLEEKKRKHQEDVDFLNKEISFNQDKAKKAEIYWRELGWSEAKKEKATSEQRKTEANFGDYLKRLVGLHCVDYKEISKYEKTKELYLGIGELKYKIDFSNIMLKSNCFTIFKDADKNVAVLHMDELNKKIYFVSDEGISLSNMNFPQFKFILGATSILLKKNNSFKDLIIRKGNFLSQFMYDGIAIDGNLKIAENFLSDSDRLIIRYKASVEAKIAYLKSNKLINIVGKLVSDEITLKGSEIALSTFGEEKQWTPSGELPDSKEVIGNKFIKIYYSILTVGKPLVSPHRIEMFADPNDPNATFYGEKSGSFYTWFLYHRANIYNDSSKSFSTDYFLNLNDALQTNAVNSSGCANVFIKNSTKFSNAYNIQGRGLRISSDNSLHYDGRIKILGSSEKFKSTDEDDKFKNYNKSHFDVKSTFRTPCAYSDIILSPRIAQIFTENYLSMKGSEIKVPTDFSSIFAVLYSVDILEWGNQSPEKFKLSRSRPSFTGTHLKDFKIEEPENGLAFDSLIEKDNF